MTRNLGYNRSIATQLGAIFDIIINPDDNTNVVLKLRDTDLVVTMDPAAAVDLGHTLRKAGQYAATNTVRKQNANETQIIPGQHDPLRGGEIH